MFVMLDQRYFKRRKKINKTNNKRKKDYNKIRALKM